MEESNVFDELAAMKEQINYLQNTIEIMQNELESKDREFENECRERERVLVELKKHKQCNLNLKQQLEDERTFYLKEKEYYCKEISEVKQMRKKKTEVIKNALELADQKIELENTKSELSKVKLVLAEAFTTNYNLSIKYLRLKNSMRDFKTRFRTLQRDSAKMINDLSQKFMNAKEQIEKICNKKFQEPMSPSNKNYLKVLKENSHYMHENLNLRIQVLKLQGDTEKIKADKIRIETNAKLKLMSKSSNSKMCQTLDFCNICQVNTESGISICRRDSEQFSELKPEECASNSTMRTRSTSEVDKINFG